MENATPYTQMNLSFTPLPANTDYNAADLNQDAVIQMALNILSQRNAIGEPMVQPSDAADYLRLKLSGYKNEVFCAIFLNTRHRIIAFEELFFGTIDGAAVYPRVVVQRVMAHNASAVVFAHNHPSGITEPSEADKFITKKLIDAMSLIDVRVLDHIVVGDSGTTSFAECGLL